MFSFWTQAHKKKKKKKGIYPIPLKYMPGKKPLTLKKNTNSLMAGLFSKKE